MSSRLVTSALMRRGVRQPGARLVGLLEVQVGREHARALGREPAHRRAADPRSRPRHDRDLAFEHRPVAWHGCGSRGSSSASTPTPRASRAGSSSAACSTSRATTMLDKMQALEADDRLRRVLLFEPRGSAPLSADVVFPSAHPEADAGFVIMESSSYEGMSGHEHDQHRRRAARDRRDRDGRAGDRAGAGGAGRARAGAGGCAGGRVERIKFENVPSFALALDAPVEVPDVGHVARSTWPTAARSARSSTRRRWGSRSCPTRRASWPSSGERIRPHVNEQVTVAHPLDPGAVAPVLRGLRRAAAGRRRRAARDDRLAGTPGPLADGDGDVGPDRRAAARGRDGRDVHGGERARHAVRGARRRARQGRVLDAVVPAITGRAWITGFHQLVVDPSDPWGPDSSWAIRGAPATWRAC